MHDMQFAVAADELLPDDKPPRFKGMCQELGLPDPDGRPFYQYRLSNSSFIKLKDYLAAFAHKINSGDYRESDFFVLWAAEWFRRCYRGGLRRWQDIGEEIGFNLSQAEWRKITDRGLRQWGIQSFSLNGINHRLLTLARQGGFPVAAIEGDGWAAKYLERVVSELLARPEITVDNAMELARASQHLIPESWQGDEFLILSADLAIAIVSLRREAEHQANATGFTLSAWLELNKPDWQDTLPIVVDSKASLGLLNGLMRVAPIKGGGGSIHAVRMLKNGLDGWEPILRLQLSGTVSSVQFANLQTDYGRLRVFAAGQMARYISGELAIFEPPSSGENIWGARSLRRQTPEFSAPFHTPAEIELRAENTAVSRLLMPGGAPVVSKLQVFAAANGSDETNPMALTLLGTSSGQYRADPVFLHIPDNWRVETTQSNEITTQIGQGQAGYSLWRIQCGAIVHTADSEAYRIWAGQKADARDQLIITGKTPDFLTLQADDMQLYYGSPAVRVKEHGRERAAITGELWQRRFLETKEWSSVTFPLLPGVYELAWKDHQTGYMRDRCKIALLPGNFKLQRSIVSGLSEFTIEGWNGLSIPQHGKEIAQNRWQIAASAVRERQIPCTLRWNSTTHIIAMLTPSRAAGFAYWEGGALPPNNRFALADAKKLVAIADERYELVAVLRDRNKQLVPGAEMRWWFDRELPVSAIRDDIASLLLPLGDLDADVRMNFHNARAEYWYAKQFDINLENTSGGLLPSHSFDRMQVQIAGRPIANPRIEEDFGTYSLEDLLNRKPIVFPLTLADDWLIYLRDGDRVLSRPKLYHGTFRAALTDCPLAGAMRIKDQNERQEAILLLCQQAEGDTADAYCIVRSIIELTVSLRGLPPSTFNIFTCLANHPKLAARLVLFASEEERPQIMALADSLPFCWFLIAQDCWYAAANAIFQRMKVAMADVPDAERLINETIATKCRNLVTYEPALAALLSLPANIGELSPIAQSFLNRSADGIAYMPGNPFRPQLNAELPSWKFDESFHAVLDVPCAAALAALGRFSPNSKQICRIKTMARSYPQYFESAFTAYYKEKSRV